MGGMGAHRQCDDVAAEERERERELGSCCRHPAQTHVTHRLESADTWGTNCVCLGALVPVAAAVIVEDSEVVFQHDSFFLSFSCMQLPSGLSSSLQLSYLPVSSIRVRCVCLSRSSRALTVPLISSPSKQVLVLTVSEAADMSMFSSFSCSTC